MCCTHLRYLYYAIRWVKVQLRGTEFLRKRGHYSKKNCSYLVSLCLHKQGGDTIVDGWPQFECSFHVFFPIWFWHTAAIASTWQPVKNLSMALSACGCNALQCVIGWEPSWTCIVTSWSQRRRPKHVILPINCPFSIKMRHWLIILYNDNNDMVTWNCQQLIYT